METIVVSSNNTLVDAYNHLSACKGGTILLEALPEGERYNFRFGDYSGIDEAPVMIMSADADNRAVIMKGDLQNVSNVTIESVDVVFKSTDSNAIGTRRHEGDHAFKVRDSENFTLSNVVAWSDASGPALFSGGRAADFMEVRRSDGVTVENVEIQNFAFGMSFGHSSQLRIENVEMSGIQSDHLRLYGVQDAIIKGNYFRDPFGSPHDWSHDDFIQIWGNGIYQNNERILIEGNVLHAGAGSKPQGIHIRNERFKENGFVFEDILIRDNIIFTAAGNQINVQNSTGTVVENNTAIRNHSAQGILNNGTYTEGMDGWIRVETSENFIIKNNVAEKINNLGDENVSGNVILTDHARELASDLSNHFVNVEAMGSGDLRDLMLRADSPLNGTAGASRLWYNDEAENLTAVADVTIAPTDQSRVTFDARLSRDMKGLLDPSSATFAWKMSDGAVYSGTTVTHDFAVAGQHGYTLTVTHADGRIDTIARTIDIEEAIASQFSVKDGAMVVDTGAAPQLRDSVVEAQGIYIGSGAMMKMPRHVDTMGNTKEFSVSMTLTPEVVGESGSFFRVHAHSDLHVTGDGRVAFEIATTNGPVRVVTEQGGLFDAGETRSIAIDYDANAGKVDLLIDGAIAGTAETTSTTLGQGNYEIMFGNAFWNEGRNFNGWVEDVRLSSEPLGPTPSIATPPISGRLEAGTLVVDQPGADTWHSVTFDQAIPDARVVMGPPSHEGGHPAVMRVRNVTETGFEFQIEEWLYLDGDHVAETVSWIAGSAGQHTLATGQSVAFGRIEAEDDTSETVTLEGFADTPAVFAQITSHNGGQTVTDRINAVTPTGFSVRMREEEANNQKHFAETLDWMAIDYGTATQGAVYARRAEAVTDRGVLVAFDAVAGADELVFIADMQTENGIDPAALRATHRGTDTARLFVEEEQSADAETWHIDEAVAYLALAEGSYDLFA